MKDQITRRDFLKLAGLLPVSIAAPRFISSLDRIQSNSQNVLVIVFDAWSAYHLSLNGYPRETAPNIARLADRAVVYHNHYAGGNFTTPGTASLLTGTHPWTHRAFQPGGTIPDDRVSHNIFAAFKNHYRVTYSHNLWANLLLREFRDDLEQYIPKKKYFLTGDGFDSKQDFFLDSNAIIPSLFENDEDVALVSWIRAMEKEQEGYAYSLFLSPLYEGYRNYIYENRFADIKALFPRGIPRDDYDYFLLEDGLEAIEKLLTTIPQPFTGYFHFWPPHAPYNTNKDFIDRFYEDGYTPPSKPFDLFGDKGDKTKNRREYDEYILYVDREFGRFYDRLEQNGLLENTWLVLTSDHGELFERGIEGHRTPVLYEAVIRVPLLIFEPGRISRMDIYENTSAVDILPTLLHVTGQEPSDWAEGVVLPPFSPENSDPERSVYVMQPERSEQFGPLNIATLSIRKGDYKLLYFYGYKELGGAGERVELYNIKDDPEELNNLYDAEPEIRGELLDELKAKLKEMNAPYLSASQKNGKNIA
ncbi:MAG: sulfatase-like hydrolase/transferase [Anaerolineales bacterium]